MEAYQLKLVKGMFSFFILGTVLLFSEKIWAETPAFSPEQSLLVLANNTVTYNPKTLTWKAINSSGKVVRAGRGSGGKGYCPDIKRSCRTPSGTYSVISKGGPDCRSSRYPVGKGGARMPYCMFFSKYYAIHGSYDLPNYNASHGCIRISPSDAAWLSKNFVNIGTRIVVYPY